MAVNYVQKGKSLDFTAPTGGVKSGQGILLGAFESANLAQDSSMAGGVFGIVQGDSDEGEPAVLCPFGVWELPKGESEAISQWADVYWDDVNELITAVNSNNFKRVGVAVLAAASGAGNELVTVQLRPDGKGVGAENMVINHVATAAHTAGEPFLLEQGSDRMLAVPLKDAEIGDTILVMVNGPMELAKAAVVIDPYDKMFWDDTNEVVTNVSASGLVEIGYATKASLAGDAFGQVRVKDNFVTPVS